MTNNNISIQERTENFSIRVIRAYCQLSKRNHDDAAKVLSKQFLRSGTSNSSNKLLRNYRPQIKVRNYFRV